MNGISKVAIATIPLVAGNVSFGAWAETWTDSAGHIWAYRIVNDYEAKI